jgi:hypothetical protein
MANKSKRRQKKEKRVEGKAIERSIILIVKREEVKVLSL